jgi:hypothetical protein
MIPQDPYAPPVAPAGTEARTGSGVPEGAVTALRGTRPWVRFLSILGFVGAGFMLLAGVAMLVTGGALFLAEEQAPAGGGGMMAGLSVLYIFLALIYVAPSLYLFRYASAITRLTSGGGGTALVEALGVQRSFWRLVGILAVATLVLYALIIVGFAIAAAVGAFGS